MHLVEVSDKKTVKLFHKVPHIIYKEDPNWACPLEVMIENIFNPEKNPSFKNGEAKRWILFDHRNNLIGRIAAFYNRDRAYLFEQPTGCCGFFECINNQEAAGLLFDASRIWLKSKGLEAMDGPANFGENFINWGLLVDGFIPQGFGMPYNPPYYHHLYDHYGFQMYFKQFSYHLDISLHELPERFWKVAEWVAKKPQFSFRHFSWEQKDKFIDDLTQVYNEAWRFFEHFKPLEKDEIVGFIESSRMMIEEKFIWFAYHEDRPIGLFVMLPDLNQILIRLNGKLNTLNLIRLMWYKKRKVINRTRGIIMGIIPKYQRSGIESAIFWNLKSVMLSMPWYKEMELSWAGDYNPKIVALYESVGGRHMKTHYTMRYIFDRSKPFLRAPIIVTKATEEKK